MVTISRIEVNHDGFGGTAPDAMVWDKGGIVKTRASSFRLIVDHATLPGPPGFLGSTWCTLFPLPIIQNDVAVWPYSVGILLEFSSFVASLHWPQGNLDLGKLGISYFEPLLMFEIFAGHRLLAEKTVRSHLRPRGPWFFWVSSWYRARDPAWVSVSPKPFQGFRSSCRRSCWVHSLST